MTGAVVIQKQSMDWFLYDNGLRHERVNESIPSFEVWVAYQISLFVTCINLASL